MHNQRLLAGGGAIGEEVGEPGHITLTDRPMIGQNRVFVSCRK